MHVALFTPLSPQRTALADVIEGIIPFLVKNIDITLVTTGDYQPSLPLIKSSHVPVISYQRYIEQPEHFDLVVYNLGDEPNLHGYMFDAIDRYPGVVLLHDLVLHHAIFQRTWAQGKLEKYIEALSYSYGSDVAEDIIRQVKAGNFEIVAAKYPLVERILDTSLAVVGFNRYMVTRITEITPDVPVCQLHLPFYLPEGLASGDSVSRLRHKLAPNRKHIIATFGLFNSQKRLEITLRAVRRLIQSQPETAYVLIGASMDSHLESRLNELHLLDNVVTTGWLSPAEFTRYMQAVDIAVQLRYPHVGGTPYTPIRLLGLGVPTIISDIEPQADFPAEAVIRIAPDQTDEEDQLYEAMAFLLNHPEERRRMGDAARQYIAANHDPETQARLFAEFLLQVRNEAPELRKRAAQRSRGGISSQHPSSNLVYLVGRTLAEIGVYSSDTELLRALAGPIDDLSPKN